MISRQSLMIIVALGVLTCSSSAEATTELDRNLVSLIKHSIMVNHKQYNLNQAGFLADELYYRYKASLIVEAQNHNISVASPNWVVKVLASIKTASALSNARKNLIDFAGDDTIGYIDKRIVGLQLFSTTCSGLEARYGTVCDSIHHQHQ